MFINYLFLFFILQIDKLVYNGADILAHIPIGPKKIQGTALDYAYHIFNLVSDYSPD